MTKMTRHDKNKNTVEQSLPFQILVCDVVGNIAHRLDRKEGATVFVSGILARRHRLVEVGIAKPSCRTGDLIADSTVAVLVVDTVTTHGAGSRVVALRKVVRGRRVVGWLHTAADQHGRVDLRLAVSRTEAHCSVGAFVATASKASRSDG
jgi:hypothetical protein